MNFTGDGQSVRGLWDADVRALLQCYTHFENLVPAESRSGAAHSGEDGRYVESILRTYLQKYLPRDLEVLTGFILRPAVITAKDGDERSGKGDRHSTQLDILVLDTAHFPVFHRFEQNVVAPPEGVVAVLSVKKHLRPGDVTKECNALRQVADLCRCKNQEGKAMRGPFLGIVSMDSLFSKQQNNTTVAKTSEETVKDVLDEVLSAYQATPYFDQIVGYVGALKQWSVTKRRPPQDNKNANAILANITYSDGNPIDWGLQFILSGILSVYYEPGRGQMCRRPGFTAFAKPPSEHAQIGIPFRGTYLPDDSWDALP